MKYLFKLLSRNKNYVIVFILFSSLSLPNIIDICSGYLSYYNFDLQEFLLWNYAANNSLIPYMDIFYPYGLLNYFRNSNLIFSLMYYLVLPILFTTLFFVFKKNFKDKFILYFSIATFYIFLLISNGFQTFSRYGLLAVFSLLFSYIIYSKKKLSKHLLIYCGIILGLIMFGVSDQGFYLFFSFIFIILLGKYVNFEERHFSLFIFFTEIIKELSFTATGFLIGLVPLWLFYNGNFHFFLNYFNDVKQIIVVSKTPFFSFVDSPANIFTISILIFAIFYNFLKLFFLKHKFTLSSFLQTSLIITILIMEQKSIIRSIDRQIVFVSFILLMFLVYDFVDYFRSKNMNKKYLYVFLVMTTITAYILKIDNRPINFMNLFKNYNLLITNQCLDNNLNYFSINNESYTKIIYLLKKQQGFNGKIFSFPTGDSAFYPLLKQKPPYYNAIFEGASYDNQNSIINYIRNNEIEYVTLNTNKSSLQDGVPDYIRQSFLFRYILNNYYPFAIISDHIILKKDKNKDFFISEILQVIKDYKNYLLDVYLYKIPYSEGLYKYSYLVTNNKLIIKSNTIDTINSFFKTNNFYSTDKVLVLIPNVNYNFSKFSFVKFQAENGNSTTIYFNPCKKNEPCIINFSRIPLFYQERLLTKLILDKDYKGKIMFFVLKNPGNLW